MFPTGPEVKKWLDGKIAERDADLAAAPPSRAGTKPTLLICKPNQEAVARKILEATAQKRMEEDIRDGRIVAVETSPPKSKPVPIHRAAPEPSDKAPTAREQIIQDFADAAREMMALGIAVPGLTRKTPKGREHILDLGGAWRRVK